MKHLITLAIALITAATLSSCGVTTTITYGDISVLDLNGKQIRQWDNCTMDVSVKDNYSGQNLQKTYAIKNGGGLAFTDDSGESHYVAGGVIIVDNIHTGTLQQQFSASNNSKSAQELTEELEKVNQEITETLRYIRANKKKRTSLGEYQDQQAKLKQLRQRRTQIENLLRERWRLD